MQIFKKEGMIMKRFIGTKVIEAKPMTRGEYNKYRGWTIPADENPADEGYLVKYSDDYESWSPKKQFDEAYRACDNMTFGLAIEAMKKGMKVARKGWNGKGMYLFLTTSIDFETKADLSSCRHLEGELTLPSIVMKTADDKFVVGWLASQTDMLAEDWIIVE